MLPEYLFTVGQSMQEIARDEFNLLSGGNGSGERDMCVTVSSQQHSHCRTPSPFSDTKRAAETDSSIDGGAKLEACGSSAAATASTDLFPTHPTTWQQHPMNSVEHAHHRLHQPHATQLSPQPHRHRFNMGAASNGKPQLLPDSDDPLICRGANDDDHPVELKSLIAAVASDRQHAAMTASPPAAPPQQRHQPNGCSPLIKQQLKVKASLMSAQNQFVQTATPPPLAAATISSTISTKPPRTHKPKKKSGGVLKLRFHHQALPPEYLSHYEATQGQLGARAAVAVVQQPPAKAKDPTQHTRTAHASHGPKLGQTAKLPPPKSSHENVRSWLQKIAEIQRSAEQQQQQQHQSLQPPPPLQVPHRPPMEPHDANNNHQASLMHPAASSPPALIAIPPYYGEHPPLPPLMPAPGKRVIQYADLPYMGEITLDNCKPRRGRKPKKADICHLIYKNYGTIFPGTPQHALRTRMAAADSGGPVHKAAAPQHCPHLIATTMDEPLNLCLRDCQATDLCSVSSGDEEDARSSATSRSTADVPTPVTTPTDLATDTLLAANMRSSMPRLEDNTVAPPLKSEPAEVYYQQLLESGRVYGLPIETIGKDKQLALKIPIPSGLFLTPKLEKISPVAPLSGASLIEYPEPLSTPSSIKSENSTGTTAATVLSGGNASVLQQPATPQKRKRSAIFIPPMPAENTSNPATEVSICKFKFTGGAKPSLQEKKMLSVDSDGNYRYYSGGAADKSMRCEFFPRDSLQLAGVLPGVNSAGAFLSAAGDKIPHPPVVDISPPSAGLTSELLQLPESPTATLVLPPQTASTSPLLVYGGAQPPSIVQSSPATSSMSYATAHSTSHIRPGERKKKSRRSTQREKLEKTFKEKGFLIQTQQLESAEGATYCKFRQLKKFTRYLFRNWKDYLPNDLQAKAAAAAAAAISSTAGGNVPGQQESAVLESILASHGFTAHHSFRGATEFGGQQSQQQQQPNLIKEPPAKV